MHAGWNLMARYARSEGEFYRKMLIITLLVGFFPAIFTEIKTKSMTPLAWECVIGSGICAAVYLFGLARAFNSSDFTIVYPVARSLPVVFVAFIDVLRGRYLTIFGWMGILLVASGCLIIPLRGFGDIRWRNYFNHASLWMVLAAMGTVGYTYLDKVAAEVIQSGADTAARYGYFYFAFSFFPYLLLMRAFPKEQRHSNDTGWVLPAFGALFGFGAYWLILWAYQLSPYASYIVAFRQFSIVLGAILAFVIYKERGVAIRLSGATLIASGLLLIAGWGR
jgi:drug/metabolite transporter (DMT)-like permease